MRVVVGTTENEINVKVKAATSASEVTKSADNELEIKGATLRELLTELSDRCGYQLVDSQTKQPNPAYAALVNGKYYQLLPRGISTKLKEGDEINIVLTVFGGG